MEVIHLQTRKRVEFLDITGKVQEVVSRSGVRSGIVVVYSPHTTAGLTVNEHADPAVREDIADTLGDLVPRDRAYRHLEGNADSHVKTSLMGPSLTLIVEDGKIQLGTWQGIFFCEFDGPRSRKVWVRVVGE